MSLVTRRSAGLDTFKARTQRAKNEGFACGSQEGKPLWLTLAKFAPGTKPTAS